MVDGVEAVVAHLASTGTSSPATHRDGQRDPVDLYRTDRSPRPGTSRPAAVPDHVRADPHRQKTGQGWKALPRRAFRRPARWITIRSTRPGVGDRLDRDEPKKVSESPAPCRPPTAAAGPGDPHLVWWRSSRWCRSLLGELPSGRRRSRCAPACWTPPPPGWLSVPPARDFQQHSFKGGSAMAKLA